MAVETSAVQITINVVDGNSGEVVSKVSQSLGQLGAAGATSGKKVKQGMDAAGAGALSAVEKTRLATEEFGIRLPRAMVKLVAQSKIAQAALSAVGTGLVALGAIQIGAMVFEQLYIGAKKLWETHLSLTKAADDYYAEVEKTRQQEFGNTGSIETTTLRINEATEAMQKFNQQALDAQKPSNQLGWRNLVDLAAPGAGGVWQALHQRSLAHDAQGKGFDEQRQIDQLRKTEAQDYHEQRTRDIELEKADAALEVNKTKAVKLRLQAEIDAHAEERRFNTERQKIAGNPVAADAGSKKEADDNAVSRVQAQAEQRAINRQQIEELAHLREEALEARLQGEARYHAQEAFAIADLKRNDKDSMAARQAIHDKFHAEELSRLRDENREIQKMRETTQLAGLTGVEHIRQEEKNRIDDIYNDPNSKMNPGQRLAAGFEVHKQAAQQIGEVNKSFADRVNEIVGQNAARELGGFQRIRQEAENEMRQIEQDFKKSGGKPEDLARAKAAITERADYQSADLSRRNAAETEQIESEARAKLMSAEKNQTRAIETEYEERLNKYREQLDKGEIEKEDYDRRAIAAEEMKNAQMVEAARAAREKMAGEFSRFFRNPMAALKEMGDKAAGEAAAALTQRVQGRLGSSGAGSIFDRIAGAPKGTGSDRSGMHGMAANGAISLASAQINVTNANITFGGAAAAGTGTAISSGGGGSTASSYSSGGSTSTMGSAGSGSGSTSFTAGSAGTAPAPGNTAGTAIGNVQQGFSLFKQARGIFGGSSRGNVGSGYAETQGQTIDGHFDKSGNFVSGASTNTGMLGGGGIGANAMGAAGGAMGMYSAYEGNGGVGGALGGAMSGMQLGMALGGPMGAAIGAAAGAIVGAIGFGGREKARVYDLKNVRPRIANDQDAYQQGSMDYLTAYSDIESLQMEAAKATNQMGPAAQSYYQDIIKKEIKEAEGKLTAQQRAGRSMYTAQAAQYDWGGPVDNFGTLTDGPDHGFARLHRNEFVVEQQAALTHGGALNAINSGATHADMAKYYGADSGIMPAASAPAGWTGDMHVHAIDAKGVAQFLDKYKHNIRSAINDSFAENSGGGVA